MRILIIITIVYVLTIGCDLKEQQPHSFSQNKSQTKLNPTTPVTNAKSNAKNNTTKDNLPKNTKTNNVKNKLSDQKLSDQIVEHLSNSKLAGIKPVSKRSLSLKIYFKNNRNAVFKPLRKGYYTARYEVAFFRIANLLDISKVPVSTMRKFRMAKLIGHLKKKHEDVAIMLEKNARTNNSGGVWGAIIEWFTEIEPTEFDKKGGKTKMQELLNINNPCNNPMAKEVSNMIVLDYVTGNWDRLSGGNLYKIKDSDKLALIDNNGSFSNWSKKQKNKMDNQLSIAKRFSERIIDKLRILKRSDIKNALILKSWKGHLLTKDEISLVLLRRDLVITHVDNLILEYGRSKVLCFP